MNIQKIAERGNKVMIEYALRQNQQRGNREVLLAQVSGLNPRDIKAYTLETKILGFAKNRFSERPVQDASGQKGTERALRGSGYAKELELSIIYPSQGAAAIVASYGDYGNVQMLQDVITRLYQLDASGEIDLFPA